MINFDDATKQNIKKHNPNWLQIPDHPYRIIITGSSGSQQIQQSGNDKIHFNAKNPYQDKYQFSPNIRESTGLKHLNDSKAFIEYSNDADDICKNIEEYNPNKKHKILIAFDNMIVDILIGKNLIQ